MEEALKDKTAKGFLWAAINNGSLQVLNIAFGIVLARKLNQADYGLIGMIDIFAWISISLQDSGFVTALTNKRDATHHDYNAVFWFNIGVSLSLYLLLFFCAPSIANFFNEPLLTSLSRYYFLCFLIASFNIVPRAVLFRQIKQKELAIMTFTALLVSGIVGITMVYNNMAYWGIATQTLTYNLMVCILSWALSKWRPCLPLLEQSSASLFQRFISYFRPIREMFWFSSKMLITNIFTHINNNIFSVVLGKTYSKIEVGTYNQAKKWNLNGSSIITGMVQGVAQPTFVAVGDDPERLRRAFSKMLRFTSFVSFPAMFGLALVSPEFIEVALGEKWLPSAQLMQLLCIGGAFMPIATLYFNLIISRGKSDVYMWNIIAQGCTILGCLVLINSLKLTVDSSSNSILPQLSAMNCQLSTITLMVLSYVVILIMWVGIWHHFLYREIRYPFLSALKDMVPFLLVAAATMGITYIITRPIETPTLLLITRIMLAAAIYVGILWVSGAKILKESIGYLRKKHTI